MSERVNEHERSKHTCEAKVSQRIEKAKVEKIRKIMRCTLYFSWRVLWPQLKKGPMETWRERERETAENKQGTYRIPGSGIVF